MQFLNILPHSVPRTSSTRYHYFLARFAGVLLPPLKVQDPQYKFEIIPPWIDAGADWSFSVVPGRPRAAVHIATLDDVEIPITTWQARMRDGALTYLAVTTGADYLPQIQERMGGALSVYKGHRYLDGVGGRKLAQIITADLHSIRYDRGGRSASVTLVAYVQSTNEAPKTIELDHLTYQSLQAGGQRRWRTGVFLADMETNLDPDAWDFVVRPGDTVVYGGEEMQVGMVAISVTPRQEHMEIVEA